MLRGVTIKCAMFKTIIRFILASACIVGMGLHQAAAQTIERIRLSDNDLSCAQIYAEVQQMDTVMQLAGPGLPTAPPAPVAAQVNLPNPAPQNVIPANLAGLNNLQGAVLVDPRVQESMARARASGLSEAQINATVGLGMQRSGLGAPSLGQMHAPTAALMTQQGISPEYQQQIANNMAAAQGQSSGRGSAAVQAGGMANLLGAGIGGQAGNAAGLASMFGAIAGMTAPKAAAPVVPAAPAFTAQALPQKPSNAGMGAQARARKEHLTGVFLSRGCKLADVVR